jgi:hypothetical protein
LPAVKLTLFLFAANCVYLQLKVLVKPRESISRLCSAILRAKNFAFEIEMGPLKLFVRYLRWWDVVGGDVATYITKFDNFYSFCTSSEIIVYNLGPTQETKGKRRNKTKIQLFKKIRRFAFL